MRKLFTYIPLSSKERPPVSVWTEDDRKAQTSPKILDNIIPHDPNKPYDMLNVIKAVTDRNEFYDIMPDFAKNIITGFGKVEGQTVGIVAN